MKIIFFCGCLEPGRDGVGDYVKLLATELVRQGHAALAIGFNDTFISNTTSEVKKFGPKNLSLIRLPSNLSSKEKWTIASTHITTFKPDWISLQYVGFGFNKYGLPLEILRLRPVAKKVQLHIMFHELWCGLNIKSGKKEKVLGFLQKCFIRAMVSVFNPKAIFTSISTYSEMLQQFGIKPSVVPIFGNISLNDQGTTREWEEFTLKSGLASLYEQKQKFLILGFFGTIYYTEGIEKLLEHAIKAAKKLNKTLGILCLGQNRGHNINIFSSKFPEIQTWQTGYLNSGMINRAMQMVDLAVATTPCDGMYKSGTAIAWIERGIPVLVSPFDKSFCDSQIGGVFQVNSSEDIDFILDNLQKTNPKSTLTEVVDRYALLDEKE